MNFNKTQTLKSLTLSVGVKIIIIIALWEALIMLFLYQIQPISPFLEGFLDISLLSISSSITIWFFVFKPFKKIISSMHLLGQEIQAIDKVSIISAADLSGKIIFTNDNFCKISGYKSEELLQKDHRILNSGTHSTEFFNEMWATLAKGKTWQGKICNRKKSGELYWVDSYLVPIFDEEGQPKLYVSFRFDITAEKLAQEALEQEKFKMVHLSRLSAIGEMSGGIAHEINNPLTIVKSSLQLASRKLQVENPIEDIPKVLESLDKAQNQVVRITKIVNGLREFSRSGNKETNEKVSTKKIFESVNDLCFEKLKNQGIKLEMSAGDYEFECNIIQIEQVLVNLINNSIDAITPLSEKWIKIEALKKDELLEISVVDSGNGITEEIAQKIMQPFFTTKEVGKGTGLGLSISRGILEKHGGELYPDIKSLNTRFVIQLPFQNQGQVSKLN